MSRHFIITSVTVLIIFGAFSVAVLLAKGYTFSPSQKKLLGTGIISIKSDPDSASVYIDEHLTTATNATIPSLIPKQYKVKVVKEGFIPWEKLIDVKEGLVSEIKIHLFPSIPTIYPLTFNGVKSPSLSPDGTKLVFVVPSGKRAGVWVWTMVKNQPIAFARTAEPHQVSQSVGSVDYVSAEFKWSTDSKEVIASVGGNNYLLDSERLNSEPKDITPTLSSTLKGWEEDLKIKNEARISLITDQRAHKIASEGGALKWSPDETRFIFSSVLDSKPEIKVASAAAKLKADQQKSSSLVTDAKVFDLEKGKEYLLPPAKSYLWLSDSANIVLVEEGKISVVDFDGSNRQVIYAGNFLDDFVFAWPDASRLVLISTFPTPTASEPNLYGINLK